jgi:hypothetical protein
MKKIFPLRLTLCWLSVNATLIFLFNGCAAPEQHSFNHDFGEDLPTQPMYYIQDENSEHFIITVQQGKPSNGAEHVIDVKDAASTVAKAECQRLGWEKWQLNYISERNQGWMRVVVAEVKREKYVAPTFPQSHDNP